MTWIMGRWVIPVPIRRSHCGVVLMHALWRLMDDLRLAMRILLLDGRFLFLLFLNRCSGFESPHVTLPIFRAFLENVGIARQIVADTALPSFGFDITCEIGVYSLDCVVNLR